MNLRDSIDKTTFRKNQLCIVIPVEFNLFLNQRLSWRRQNLFKYLNLFVPCFVIVYTHIHKRDRIEIQVSLHNNILFIWKHVDQLALIHPNYVKQQRTYLKIRFPSPFTQQLVQNTNKILNPKSLYVYFNSQLNLIPLARQSSTTFYEMTSSETVEASWIIRVFLNLTR